jgi:hypothetical protein
LQVDIISCDLVKTATPRVVLSITVKNTGNKPITTCKVSIWDNTPAEKPQTGGYDILSGTTLNPGAFASYSFTDANIGTGFDVGKSYPVKIKAGDGASTFEKTITIYCSG